MNGRFFRVKGLKRYNRNVKEGRGFVWWTLGENY